MTQRTIAGSPRLRIAGAIGLAAFGLYLATLAPSITWRFAAADSGDLAAAVATWGIPHPTGYPLYILLGGSVAHLVPVGQLAYRLNLFSAGSSAAAAACVFLAVDGLGRRLDPLPTAVRLSCAVTAALVLATARAVWAESVLTEVYALELLFAAAIAMLLVAPPLSERRLLLLAGVCGLGLTHHVTIVFSLAGVALALATAQGRTLLRRPQLLAGCLSAVLLPLGLYLLLPLRAAQHPASNWGDPTTFGRFLDVVTGAPYHHAVDRDPGHLLRTLPSVARVTFGQFAWWIVPLALAGIGELWGRCRPYALYLVVLILAPLLFVAAYEARSREAYALQTYLGLAIAAGVGGLTVARWLAAHGGRAGQRLVAAVALGGAVTVVPWAFAAAQDCNLRQDWTAWRYAQRTLAAAPTGGVLYVDTDEQTFPLWYAQRALHLRPDVHVVAIRFRDPAHQR